MAGDPSRPPVLTFPTKSKITRPTGVELFNQRAALARSKKESSKPKREDDTTTLEKVLKIDNILALPNGERRDLLKGSSVSIIHFGDFIEEIPLRLLLATSPFVRKMYEENTDIEHLQIPNELNKGAILALVRWLKRICYSGAAPVPVTRDIYQDLSTIRVGEYLGMKFYVQRIANHWWRILNRDHPQFAWATAIEKIAQDDQDRFFQCICHRFAYVLYSGEVESKDLPPYRAYMLAHPRIAARVQEIYEHIDEKQRQKEENRSWEEPF
ncbi:hypothetical protein BDV95DRAFT_654684 [Massariosphaeria phaeospora]|uniref:BTB domain-containing protein n=1 Tax=Massariosphaeria phaeospora TaxID=100035 RepID=A0A7C8IBU9_9PLEO|nr:hypothetical protein BDV95DRAFT_654684 [Massariosphaeria phaeospora]